MSRGRLRLRYSSGARLREPELREMWRLRLEVMALKDGVDPEQDFRRFAATCRQARIVVQLRDGAAVLRGMSVWIFETRRWQGRSVLELLPEYWMLHPRWRGDSTATLVGLSTAMNDTEHRSSGSFVLLDIGLELPAMSWRPP